MTLIELVHRCARQLKQSGVAFGHGTSNAMDEAAWLVLWRLGLPLDELDAVGAMAVSPQQRDDVQELIAERIRSRKPAAYLTREAWLQGVPFYVDERSIVPRSFIAELIMDGSIDPWLPDNVHREAPQSTLRVLDLCTGNGSLAVLAAMAWPDATVDAADISPEALEIAHINVDKHGLQGRIRIVQSDGLRSVTGPYDLILCNPPYVNANSMAQLPAEYQAEPQLALAGGADGMDFVRSLLREAAQHMKTQGVLVLEIGNERDHFESAFLRLEAVWLETNAGADQVLLVTRESLLKLEWT
jgi:ribosomal protein L3 glutamine methyltransferase